MAKPTAAEKAVAYLAAGRIIVTHARPGRVRARVRGDGAMYLVTFDGGEWTCSCPSRTVIASCAHARAVRLVTAPTEAPQ